MRDQKGIIHNSDWDNLIILDACRYDFFKEIHNFIPNIDGELTKLRTRGTNTGEFLTKTFPNEYDIEIFSGSPVVNGKGTPTKVEKYNEYVPEEHFSQIYDIWDTHWDEEKETVLPEELNRFYMESKKDYKTSKKQIFWYLQPHAPLIGSIKLYRTNAALGDNYGLNDIINHELYFSDAGKEIFEKAYALNLIRALFNVAKLLPHLEGKTVITSDHGEKLPTEGMGHPSESEKESLRAVPWLEIDEGEKIDIANCSDETFVKSAYENVLEREADKEGLEFYKKELSSNRITRKELLENLMISDGFREQNKDFVLNIKNEE